MVTTLRWCVYERSVKLKRNEWLKYSMRQPVMMLSLTTQGSLVRSIGGYTVTSSPQFNGKLYMWGSEMLLAQLHLSQEEIT